MRAVLPGCPAPALLHAATSAALPSQQLLGALLQAPPRFHIHLPARQRATQELLALCRQLHQLDAPILPLVLLSRSWCLPPSGLGGRLRTRRLCRRALQYLVRQLRHAGDVKAVRGRGYALHQLVQKHNVAQRVGLGTPRGRRICRRNGRVLLLRLRLRQWRRRGLARPLLLCVRHAVARHLLGQRLLQAEAHLWVAARVGCRVKHRTDLGSSSSSSGGMAGMSASGDSRNLLRGDRPKPCGEGDDPSVIWPVKYTTCTARAQPSSCL